MKRVSPSNDVMEDEQRPPFADEPERRRQRTFPVFEPRSSRPACRPPRSLLTSKLLAAMLEGSPAQRRAVRPLERIIMTDSANTSDGDPGCPLRVIRQYQDAHDRHDTSRALAAFAPDATVIDEDHEHRGTAAIRQWLDTAAHGSSPARAPVSAPAGSIPTPGWSTTDSKEPFPAASPTCSTDSFSTTVVLPSSSSHPDHTRSTRTGVVRDGSVRVRTSAWPRPDAGRVDGSGTGQRFHQPEGADVPQLLHAGHVSRRCRYSSSSISPRAKRCARTSSALLGAAGIADSAGGAE